MTRHPESSNDTTRPHTAQGSTPPTTPVWSLYSWRERERDEERREEERRGLDRTLDEIR
jgi:hypothetical protein